MNSQQMFEKIIDGIECALKGDRKNGHVIVAELKEAAAELFGEGMNAGEEHETGVID